MAQGQGYKKCPKCNESVWVGATTCKFCQADIPRKGPVKTSKAAPAKRGRPKKVTVIEKPTVTVVPDPYTETTLVRQKVNSLYGKRSIKTGKRKPIGAITVATPIAPCPDEASKRVMLYVRTLTDVPTLEFPNDVAVVTA